MFKRAKYNADDLKTMAKNGQAMPDGSYPIGDESDLTKAIHAVGRGGASHNAIRLHIMKRARALGLTNLIPDNWQADGSMKSAQYPKDNLIRAMGGPDALESDGRTLYGHFAVFNTPTMINDSYEGKFIEQIAPGAFGRTLQERGKQVKVLFNHGQDPSIGNKPLGTIRSAREDKIGVAYDVELFHDTTYVQDLLPGLRAGAYGASFRFKVVEEIWDMTGDRSADNPDGLDVRTITDAELYEFGPVTFPAYAEATAGVRSMTGDFVDQLIRDPLFVARFTERAGLKVVQQMLETVPATPSRLEQYETAFRNGTVSLAEIRALDDQPVTDTAVSADGDEWEEARQRRLATHARSTAGFVAHLARLKEAPQ
jgi:HK97 family phage prohead protease